MNKPTTPNYMLQTVRCRIPRAPAGEQQSLFVGLNQKNYLIPRGVSVELPLPVLSLIHIWSATSAFPRRHQRLQSPWLP